MIQYKSHHKSDFSLNGHFQVVVSYKNGGKTYIKENASTLQDDSFCYMFTPSDHFVNSISSGILHAGHCDAMGTPLLFVPLNLSVLSTYVKHMWLLDSNGMLTANPTEAGMLVRPQAQKNG